MATRKSTADEQIVVRPLSFRTVEIPIVGETELIVHNWSEKAKRQMLDKQMGKAVERKPKKDPEEDYHSSIYYREDGTHGFPASGFKAAIVYGCRNFENVPMTRAKVALRVNGDLVQILGEPRMREDMVRLETGVADIRYRAGYKRWKTKVSVTFNESIISLEMLVNLINAAGFGGIGEWRPSSPKSASGSYGCFRVATAEEWEVYK